MANLTLVERIFDRWSAIELTTTTQGRIGLELATSTHFHLILLDLHLPDILGDEVLRTLRSLPDTRDTPIVMVSASAMKRDIDRLMQDGATAYLTKPLDIGSLEDTVCELLGVKSLKIGKS